MFSTDFRRDFVHCSHDPAGRVYPSLGPSPIRRLAVKNLSIEWGPYSAAKRREPSRSRWCGGVGRRRVGGRSRRACRRKRLRWVHTFVYLPVKKQSHQEKEKNQQNQTKRSLESTELTFRIENREKKIARQCNILFRVLGVISR